MRYQALALDLDGTLTNSRKEVTPATRAALGRAMFEGCKVILASGRPLVGIQPVAWALGLPRLGGYILAYNGGQVVDCRTGETLRQDRLDPAQIHRLCAFARQQGVSILTYDRDGIVTEHPEDPFVQKEAGINRIPVQKVPDLAAYVTYPITKMLLGASRSAWRRWSRPCARSLPVRWTATAPRPAFWKRCLREWTRPPACTGCWTISA